VDGIVEEILVKKGDEVTEGARQAAQHYGSS
jgi:biotin carboxyl carrier protein